MVDNYGTTDEKLSLKTDDAGDLELASIDAPNAPAAKGVAGSQKRAPRKHSWPILRDLGLSKAERESRILGIGGSDANVILSGDRERILKLWREKRGEQTCEDLSGVLPVMLGCWTEPFNRQWYETISGNRVSKVGLSDTCSEHHWRRCTLDGLVKESGAIFEAKHTSAFSRPDEILDRYMPQLQHNMAVMKVDKAVLSVIFGNSKFEAFEVAADWLYQFDLFEAELDFWNCVLNGREPVPALIPAAPKPLATREICFEGNNAWAAAAADWRQYREPARTHAAACGLIKSLVEDDVTRAFGHGIEAKRSKSGAISIRAVG